MPPRFYYTNAKNQAVGPVEAAEIAWLADTGIVTEETRIIAEGERSWYSYRRWHQEFRGSVRLPKPLSPPPAAPAKPAQWPRWVVATGVLAAVIAGGAWALQHTVLDRPTERAVTDFVTASLNRRGLRVGSFKSETKRIAPDRVQVFYRAAVVTASPLYTAGDTPGYLKAHFGPEAVRLAAQNEAHSSGSPLGITVLNPATPSGVALICSGRLVGTRTASGWRLAEEVDRQFASATISGQPRRAFPGQTFVDGDAEDETALKLFVDQATVQVVPKPESPVVAASAARPAAASATNVVTLSVPANVRWFDTGIDLEIGETVSISADGVVSSGPRIPASESASASARERSAVNETPDGEPLVISTELIRTLLAPLLPAWSLIGKVGTSVPFEVGSLSTLHSPDEGRLYLSVNAPSFENRAGVWRVTLTLPPGSRTGSPSGPSLAGPDSPTRR